MQKIKNNLLVISSLVFIASFCFSIAFAQNTNKLNGAEHRSTVGTFVQNLLNVADKQPEDIGNQIKSIAQTQDENKDNVSDLIDKVGNRNWIKTFFVGTDYKNTGQLRSEMVKTRNQINQLNNLLNKVTDAGDKTALQQQIQTLEQEQQKINSFISSNENKFSLFGWVAKLFNPPAPTIKITEGTKGRYLVDANGKSLYHFTNDTAGKNNCAGTCASTWPVFYTDSIVVGSPLKQSDFNTITTASGAKQITYKEQPLYYYINDVNIGDTLGDGVNGVWFLTRP